MEIFKNDAGYLPLIPNLEGYWDKPIVELPIDLRKVVERRFALFPWDSLSVSNRRNIAAQYDYQHDPNHEPSTYFELICFSNELKDWIEKARQDKKDSAVVVLRDVEDRIEKILDTDRIRVGTEIQRLRDIAAQTKTIKSQNTNSKQHGNTVRFAKNREEVLGSALSVLIKWPEQCKNGTGKIEATKIRVLIEEKGYKFWREDGQPPLSSGEIEKLLRDWINKTSE